MIVSDTFADSGSAAETAMFRIALEPRPSDETVLMTLVAEEYRLISPTPAGPVYIAITFVLTNPVKTPMTFETPVMVEVLRICL